MTPLILLIHPVSLSSWGVQFQSPPMHHSPLSCRMVLPTDSSRSRLHFAVMPPALVEPCVLAGAPEGGLVLVPFAGAGTVGVVCRKHRRRFIGIELNPAYVDVAVQRWQDFTGEVAVLDGEDRTFDDLKAERAPDG